MVSVLLTGASGYIGSHLAAALAQTSCKVHAILRPNSNDALLKLYAPQAIIHHYQGNYSNLVSIIEKVKPQLVFHLAASGNYHHQPIDITKITQANLELGMNLLEAMDKVGCRYLINTGTYWQHYTGEHYDPVCLYAATKQAFEAIIDYYVAAKSFNVVTLKLFDVYGPNDPRPKLFNLLFQAAINQIPLMLSPGEQQIDYIYIDDVISAFLVAARVLQQSKEEKQHQRYFVGTTQPQPLRKIVLIFESLLGSTIPIEWGKRPYREREIMRPWIGDLLPEWSAKTSIELGLKQVITALKAS